MGGLQGRGRTLIARPALARRHGFSFAVLWEPGPCFSDDPWHDLFANDLELWDRARYDAALADGVPVSTRWGDAALLESWRVARAIRRRGLVFDGGFRPIHESLRRGALRLLRPSRRARILACRELRPAPAIARAIDAFAAEHRLDATVGVHIRRGDAATGPHRHEYEPSSDDAFEQALRREPPDTRFFLATDCPATEARFRERSPGWIVTRDQAFVPSVYGETKGGQGDAVTELCLLASTRRIVGTQWSTFGDLAARIGGIPIRTARDA